MTMIEINNDIKVRFVTGECSDEELQAVAHWMKESEANAAELLDMERMYRELQAEAMPSREVAMALERTHSLIAGQAATDDGSNEVAMPRRTLLLRRWVAAAAVALVLVCVGLYTMHGYKTAQPEIEYLIAKASATTPRQVVLADGTHVWLNCGATLRYPKQFSDTLREVALTGEGYFEVAKDHRKPFVVDGTTMNVRVLGTVFNFNDNGRSGASEVSLLEGSVRVVADSTEESIVLKPGQKASLEPSGSLTVNDVDARLDAVWHTRVIPFEKSNIRQIADVLEQLYDVKIVVGKNVDNSKTYSGEIQWNENIETELSLLQNTLPINYEIKGRVVTFK